MVTAMLVANVLHYIFGTAMFLTALFLILLVLVQRGRGGGLSGAFGGLGGQSAFGARAGDTFTYITIWASAAWIVLCIAAVKLLSSQPSRLGTGNAPVVRPIVPPSNEDGSPPLTQPDQQPTGGPTAEEPSDVPTGGRATGGDPTTPGVPAADSPTDGG